MANPAAWKCDACRESGLENKRRCGWVPAALTTPPRVVWRRRHVSTDVCPKSLITAQSITWIEAFYAWKRLRFSLSFDLNAREAEAFLILEEELLSENNGTEQ